MSEANHDLPTEFPEFKHEIHRLKLDSAYFAELEAAYHDVVKELHQIEARIETPEDLYVETLKKKRLALKDEIALLLRQAAA